MSSSTHPLKPGAGGSGAGETILTDAGTIATITNEANWDENGYTGSTAGLVAGNAYYDTVNLVKYYFNGTILTRTTYNDVA